jgi:ferredoxin
MHTRYKEPEIFEKMLVDLCEMHCKRVPVLSVVDAIYGMEGNGPSGGDVRNYGLLLSSLNPFNLDVACSAVLGIEKKVGYVNEAIKRGLCHANASSLELTDGKIDEFKIEKVKLPETKSLVILKILPTMFGGKINKFFEPKPSIMKNKCIGCGECMRSCPAKTIEIIKNKSGKRLAKINAENCIKCYCCQELCPINAVKIKKNLVFKILK